MQLEMKKSTRRVSKELPVSFVLLMVWPDYFYFYQTVTCKEERKPSNK